jgi:hypothetical protein
MRTRDLVGRINQSFGRRRLRLGFAAAVLPVGLAGAILGGNAAASAHAASPHGSSTGGGVVTYTAKVTIPAPPSSNFSGASGGGDGWSVALSSTQVFNVFHHQAYLGVNCHNQSDASLCWPNFSYKTISDKVNGTPVTCDGSAVTAGCYESSGQPGMYFDQASRHLYVFATHVTAGPAGNLGTAGVLCIDTTLPASDADPMCASNGFTPLSAVGDGDITSLNCCAVNFSAISDPQIVGTNWYAFNFYFGSLAAGKRPGSTAVVTTRNKLLCFSLKTFTPCANQPYSVNFGTGATIVRSGLLSPSIADIGGQLVIPADVNAAGATGNVLACYNPAVAGGSCGAHWPVSINFSQAGNDGAPFPLLTASGAVQGFCLPTGTEQCYSLAGTSVSTPANLASVVGGSDGWNGPAVTIAPRVYVPNGNSNDVTCFDYSKDAGCSKFPFVPSNLDYLYTVNPDPQRPTCLWVNADGGADQIQDFDAFTGGQCGRGPVHILASSFVVPIVECAPTSWTSLQVVQPYPPSTFGGGSVEFEDADGNPLPGVPTTDLSSTGFIDLSHFNLSTRNGLPQFVLTLNKPPANLTQVVLVLKWQAAYSPNCLQPGTTATPPSNNTQGYRLLGGDGGIFDFHRSYRGSVGFPSPPGLGLHIFNFVGMALAPNGYWLVQSNGGIFSFHAPFLGSLPASGVIVDNIVGIASTPDGRGYWEVDNDGAVYSFGDAHYHGGCAAPPGGLSPCLGITAAPSDIVAIVSPDAGGYWLIGRDGHVFTFGDAKFHGDCIENSGCGSLDDIVGAFSPDPGGYWFVGADGGVFAFGDAKYRGSCPVAGSPCNGTSGVVGIAGPDAGGYWLARSDGSVYTFGDAKFLGSCRQAGSPCFDLVRPIVGITG